MKFLLLFLLCSFIFVLGFLLGAALTRRQIAEAVRLGRLTVQQRVDAIADQIERGPAYYRPGELR